MSLRTEYLLWMGTLAAPTLFMLIIIFASLQTDYSYSLHSVSLLGATTSKFHFLMNLFGFIGIGFLIILGSLGAYLASKKLGINRLFSFAMAAFGFMFMGVACPMDTHFEMHLFFANKMLVPLYASMLFLFFFMWHWNAHKFYKTLVYLSILAMFILQVTDVVSDNLVILQKLKIIVIFSMYSVVFLCLNSSLKKA